MKVLSINQEPIDYDLDQYKSRRILKKSGSFKVCSTSLTLMNKSCNSKASFHTCCTEFSGIEEQHLLLQSLRSSQLYVTPKRDKREDLSDFNPSLQLYQHQIECQNPENAVVESNKICDDDEDIKTSPKAQLVKVNNYQFSNLDLLSKNEITKSQRYIMVKWIDMVSRILSFEIQTFELSCHLMDLFFLECQKINRTVRSYDLYIVGITCIWIATKVYEVYVLSVELVEKELGHCCFSQDEIKKMEREILQVIHFKIPQRFLYTESVYYLMEHKSEYLSLMTPKHKILIMWLREQSWKLLPFNRNQCN